MAVVSYARSSRAISLQHRPKARELGLNLLYERRNRRTTSHKRTYNLSLSSRVPWTPQDKRERRVNISMTRLYLRPIKMSHYQCIIFIEAWLSHQSTRAGRLTGPGPGGLAAQFLSLRTCQMECHRKGAPVCDTRHGKAARRPGKSVSPFPIFAAKALAGRASRVAKGFTGGINEKLYKHIKVRPIKNCTSSAYIKPPTRGLKWPSLWPRVWFSLREKCSDLPLTLSLFVS